MLSRFFGFLKPTQLKLLLLLILISFAGLSYFYIPNCVSDEPDPPRIRLCGSFESKVGWGTAIFLIFITFPALFFEITLQNILNNRMYFNEYLFVLITAFNLYIMSCITSAMVMFISRKIRKNKKRK
jgi:hypothetical protein